MSVRSYDQEPANGEPANGNQAISGNLFAPILGLVGIGVLACLVWALGLTDPSRDEISHCAMIANDHARLACYDNLNSPRQPAKGALGLKPDSPKASQ